jgi:hypothetical protein
MSINDCTGFDDYSNGFCQIGARVQKKMARRSGHANWVRGFDLPSAVLLYRFKFIYCAAGAVQNDRT